MNSTSFHKPKLTERRNSRRIAELLNWTQPGCQLRGRSPSDIESDITIGYIAERPAALFAADPRKKLSAILPDIARLAYHSSIEWGLLSNSEGVIVFNAQRLRDSQWFSLPESPWKSVGLGSVVSKLNPDDVREDRVSDAAFAVRTPDTHLAAVDDVLVDTLDTWRDETLRHSISTENIDQKLQTLFSQFFILRCIEDRKLSGNIPTLETALNANDLESVLSRVYQRARIDIQTELFAERPYEDLPADIIRGIIRDLYTPRLVPIGDFRYNFAWIDADILGWAYQKYLSNVLSPVRPEPQQYLFSQPKREVRRVSVQKAGGVYYTPEFIVRYLTQKCIDGYFSANSEALREDDAVSLPIVADPACGSGSFLVAAVDILLDRLKQINPRTQWGKRLIKKGCIVGIDIDPRAVTLARLAVWLRLAEEPQPLPLPKLADMIRQGDSLKDEAWSGLPPNADIVLGNPPFVAHLSNADRERLSTRFPTAKGRSDLAYYFLELCVHKLAPRGLLGLVFPNRLFSSRDASDLRQLVSKDLSLLSVVDFGSNEVFVGTTSYIALLHAQRRPFKNQPSHARFIKVRHLPLRFPAWLIQNADQRRNYYSDDYVTAYDVPEPSGTSRWLFLSPSEKQFRMELEQESVLLGDIAELPQGIKTGANDVFVVAVVGTPVGDKVNIQNGFGDSDWIESRYLKKVVFGPDIQRYQIVDPRRFVIYPYEEGKHVGPAALTRIAPATLKYLERYRDLLERRSSTSTRGKGWYELAEKRDERWLNQKKLLIRELAPEPAFALDRDGTTFLIGGTAVVLADERLLLPLIAYLNSALVHTFLSQRTPEFRAAFQKYEPEALSSTPVPQSILTDQRLSDDLASAAEDILVANRNNNSEEAASIETRINNLLAKATGIVLPEL